MLEIICTECDDKISVMVGDEELHTYRVLGQLDEDSEAYREVFEGRGWVLQQAPFCDICKYDHSECYEDCEDI